VSSAVALDTREVTKEMTQLHTDLALRRWKAGYLGPLGIVAAEASRNFQERLGRLMEKR